MTLQLRRGIAVYHSLYVALSLNLKRCHLYINLYLHTSSTTPYITLARGALSARSAVRGLGGENADVPLERDS